MDDAPLRILLADDHVTVRHGLKLFIDSQPDMKVVGEASDGHAAIEGAVALKPDVVIMDISMPGRGGVDAIEHIRRLDPQARILVFTMHAWRADCSDSSSCRRIDRHNSDHLRPCARHPTARAPRHDGEILTAKSRL